jgi:dTDP-4-amino-4,6-dideoxygalactose transaminase
LLRVKLPHYARYTAARQANADAYTSELSRLPGVVIGDPAHCKCLTAQENSHGSAPHPVKIILPVAYAHNEHIWNQYTLRLPEPGQRDALKNHLQAHEIGCEIYYPRTMDEQVCFQYTPEASRSDCDVAHRLAAECISVPIYPELPAEHRQAVVAAIASFLS